MDASYEDEGMLGLGTQPRANSGSELVRIQICNGLCDNRIIGARAPSLIPARNLIVVS